MQQGPSPEHFYALRIPAPYQASHEFPGEVIDRSHAWLLDAPLVPGTVKIDLPIKGSLRREDAAKLYELAFFARGNVLDIGTNRGLSASILSDALVNSGRTDTVFSVDMDPDLANGARKSLAAHNHVNVTVSAAEASAWLGKHQSDGAQFGFAFVDHSHEYEPVRAVASLLHEVLAPHSYVAFHDFLDRRNGNPAYPDYDVTRGAIDGLGDRFTFESCCGCMGIFRLGR